MKKLSLSALIGVAAIIGCNSSVCAVTPTVQLITDPAMQQVLPSDQPVSLRLQAIDAEGKQIQNAKIRLQILTPPKTPWFSSDFPIVEGTKLLDIEAIATDGKLQLQQVMPIRGQYKLLVDIAPLNPQEFTPSQQTLTISVPERPVKYRNFAILAAILLGAGLVGGWMIGGKQTIEPGDVVPQRVQVLLTVASLVAIATLLIVNITAELAESHGSEHLSHGSDHEAHTEVLRSPSNLKVKFLGDDSATVGQLAQLAILATDPKTGKPVTDVVFKIKTTQMEHNETVFVYQSIPDASGKLQWKQQFFDGAPHKLEVEVSPQPNATRQFKSFQISKEIEVEGIAPPLHTRLITLAYFTSIIVLGLFLGIKLRQNRLNSSSV